MKHPVYNSYFNYITRQLICFTIGHNWKCSWRRKDNANELMSMDHELLPYRDRHSGNPYYEYSAGWHFKCRRCRINIRGNSWYPFWDYFKGPWHDLKFAIQWMRDKDESFKSKLAVLLTLPIDMFWQFYIRLEEDHGLPFFPVDITLDLKEWIYKKLLYDDDDDK